MNSNSAQFNRVRILDEDFEDTGKFDHNGKAIVHTVIVQRVGDGVTLAKYRDEETVDKIVEKVDAKTKKVTRERVNEVISGRKAAERACKANGWVITKN